LDHVRPAGNLALCALLGLACESAPAAREVPAAAPLPSAEPRQLPLDALSASRALLDLEALAGPATEAGSAAEEAARSYLLGQLAVTDLAVETLVTPEARASGEPAAGGPGSWTHVVATAAGASTDLFVLVAPLPAGPGGRAAEAVAEGASGAALLLELARVLSTRSLPYTTRFVWIAGGDAAGARALAAHMAAQGELPRIRLLVALERICRADLRIARDLGSQRVHREEFFDAAARAGRDRFFPRNQDYESVEAGHLVFQGAGVRPVVALVSAASSPAAAAGSGCSAQSLDAVGAVALDALDAIGRRLAKIDRFSRAPLLAPVGEAAATPAVAAPERPSAGAVPEATP
jgi:Zn-dependent M28 family amino/carboxypeptidase